MRVCGCEGVRVCGRLSDLATRVRLSDLATCVRVSDLATCVRDFSFNISLAQVPRVSIECRM